MELAEIKSLLQEQGEAFHAFKKANDERIAQVEKNGSATSEAIAKVDVIGKSLDELADRISMAEAEMKAPARNTDPSALTAEQREHKEAFFAALRNPKDTNAVARLQAAQRNMSVSVGTPADGGYALPEVIDRNIAEKIVDISPMRQIVDVRTASTTDYKILVNVHGGGYQWVGEGDTRSEQNTPQLAEVAPTFGTVQSYMFASEESMNDLFVNVESWLTSEAAIQHAKAEGIAVISGNGTKRPTGILNTAPSSAGDEDSPARAFGTVQHLPTGVADGFGTIDITSPGFHYPGDVLLDAVYALKAQYRAAARWVMNKSTLATIRKIKDSEGNYLWSPGLAAGQPASLIGYPVTEAEDMADIGAGAFPVLFGDFREGYCLVDLVGTRITIDPYTTPGTIKFYVRKRIGGKIKNDDAIKAIKCATS